MPMIDYTVNYTVYVDDELVNTVQTLNANDAAPSEIVRKIMDKTGYSLHTANCLRKVLTQNINEFTMKIE